MRRSFDLTRFYKDSLSRTLRVVAALFFLFFLPQRVSAQTNDPVQRGLEIAQEADRRDTGWVASMADNTMILRNRHGEESTRQVHVKNLEVEGDGDKSLVVFDEPYDIKGAAFLSFTHRTGPDDQWLFLPALKRVKRIASNNKSGPFMGSEFAYEDITSQEVEKYTYRYLGEDVRDGAEHFMVERYPGDSKSGYTRQVVWYDKAAYRVQRIDYYDRKETLLKTLTYHGYRQYLGQYWRAEEMRMVNHQTGKSTVIRWENYQFQTDLTDRDFDKNSLQRAR